MDSIRNQWTTRVCRPARIKNPTNKPKKENSMKIKNLLTVCGIAAALMLGAGSIYAQNNGGGNGGGGGRGGRGGNFDPAQFQQRMMDRFQQQLGITNDTDWSAIQPLVQKVMDARMALGGGRFGRFGRGGGQGGQGGVAGQTNPERDALQSAIDTDAPAAQIKELLAKYQASQKIKQAKLVAAQNDLRAVLTVKQEATATLSGLLD
jgi:hypothetical protein